MKSRWNLWVSLSVALALGAAVGYLVGLAYASANLREYRDHLEVIYFLAAGPLVLLVLLAGLTQIVVSVQEISRRSRREAATLAIATCEKYAREFFSLEPKTITKLREAKLLPPNEWKLLDDTFQWQSFADEESARTWAQAIQGSSSLYIAATEVVNLIEAIAMAFIHGKADQEIGYHTIGAPFCQCVRRWAPQLVIMRSQQSLAVSGAFAATVELYRSWEGRRRLMARSR
ncbi:MAG: hypothetical protein ABIS20_20280 [Thermoanaerobaculia bacterium]